MAVKRDLVLLSRALALVLLFTAAPRAENGVVIAEDSVGYAGDSVCTTCHKGRVLSGPHSAKSDPSSPAGRMGCETCHGPGAAHAEAGGKQETGGAGHALVRRLGAGSGLSVEERNEQCLKCHDKGHSALWKGSTHDRRGVGCGDCHNPHAKNAMYMSKPNQTEVCSTCHKDVRSQLMRTSHHPVREGKMQCSDCHNPHGAVSDSLVDANHLNEKCYECHADKRGPFIHEHAPVTEKCTNCHTPHGSSHDKLLINKTPFLCQQCHSNARHPGTLYSVPSNAPDHNVFQSVGNRAFYRNCMNCHSRVHGSNHPSGVSLAR